MAYIALGTLGFLIIHAFDFIAIKRIPLFKPVTWLVGSALLVYSIVFVSLGPDRVAIPAWSVWLGWLLLSASLLLLVYSLFVNLPFVKTYVTLGVGDRLVKTGLYALVRHPGVYGFTLIMLALFLITGSSLLLAAAPIWIALDILLVIVQDRFVFGRMFSGYEQYQRETPMLIPNGRSLPSFINGMRQKNQGVKKEERKMSEVSELFREGRYDELWQRCCGFIDLAIGDFMRIQRRLLLEQLELLSRCELGQRVMNGTHPRSVEEFRELVPLTTYTDYAPYLLKRRMDALPRKPILWQCTSGKSGEYPHRWVPVTARTLDEIEPLIFALLFFSSCTKRGEIKLRGGEKALYGMAPPPYATGTMTRVFPHELFNVLPPVEDSEEMSFEDRIRSGFRMGLSKGLDICIAMSSVAVAISERLGRNGQQRRSIRALLRDPRATLRLARGMIKSKLAGRPMAPRDIWSLKSLVTFGTDGSVYREKIKEMWGRYPLDFHGCTEALILAMQTWDYQGMTFIPNLNFFEFIPEEESIKSRQDASYQPSTLLLDEVKPGNYELVITSLHGGPFARYRTGHLIKITALRNEQLDIDIPQMTFLTRIDDQIDIAGFTRLSEKVIWGAIENSGLQYEDWMVRKEVKEKPALHLYIELREDGNITADQVSAVVHEEIKKLDTSYAELEAFTGLKPLEVTLLPRNAFMTYALRQKAAGADLAHVKPPHIGPSDATIDFLVNTARKVTARTEKRVEA